MLKPWQRVVLAICAALLICAPIAAAITSANYDNCAAHQGQYPTKDNDYNKSATLLVPAPNAVRIAWRCVGGYANANGNAITAASTFLLLIVTGLLMWVAYRQYTTTRSQLRAYVFLDSVSVSDGGSPPNIFPHILTGWPYSETIIRNFGVTPAYQVRHFSDMAVIPLGMENTLIPPSTVPNAPMTIGPSGVTFVTRSLNRALTQLEIANLAASPPTHGLIVFGRITYRDVFGFHRFTNYRAAWAGLYPPPPHIRLIALTGGNESDGDHRD